MAGNKYFDGDSLTDEAILTPDLLSKCTISTTAQRMIPETLNMKDSDTYNYYTKNLKITYPGAGGSTTMIIPDVVLHCETFDHFGKTGVYIGIPQQWVDLIRTKLLSNKHRPVFEDTALASDEHYWWTRCGFLPTPEGDENIFVIDEEGDELVEIGYASYPDLFNEVGSSVIANVTCAIKMTAKITKDRKGAITSEDEWRMGINITRVNITDLIDVPKPRTSLTQKSVAGQKDKGSSKLLQRIKQRQAANSR
jgi:hypothetical protein